MRKFAASGTKSSGRRFAVGQFKTELPHAGEELGIGIAEEVDGLHGVADDKEGAAGSARAMRQTRLASKLVLAAAGVLKFVDEQMTDAVGDRQSARRWADRLRRAGRLRNLRDLNEVDCAGFGEDDCAARRRPGAAA